MRIFVLILVTLLCFTSCGSSKRAKVVTKKERSVTSKTKKTASRTTSKTGSKNTVVSNIISKAETFEGVRYKYGGNSKKGMDCSGLVVTAFKSGAIILPRTTAELSKYGDWIDLKKVSEGDLLFFATKKNSRRVNHVGIVTKVKGKDLEFIHASTSKGVITSSLSQRYWYLAFVQVRRVL